MTARMRAAARLVMALGGLYAVACALGFGLLVVAFKLGVLAQLDILFYRGLVLIALSFLVTFGLLALALWRLGTAQVGARDAFAAAVLSLSINLGFLIVVPVTVDRSISIFVLGQMAAQPGRVFTADGMSDLFTKVYVGDDRQIARRLREQAVSGTVQRDGDGYRISARGRFVIATARIVADLFDSHAGILAPDAAALPPASDALQKGPSASHDRSGTRVSSQ